jgi:hypothetical protein
LKEFIMFPSTRRQLVLPLLLLALATPTVDAQELAGSLNQLRVLVKPGDTVTITDASGREIRGTIAELSSASLELLVEGSRRPFLESDIKMIRQRRPDSLSNGAKWGFGIGAGLGLIATASVDELEGTGEKAAWIVLGTLVYGGIGAGVGVGLDAMISSDQVIYSQATGSASHVALRPLFTRGRIGLQASLAF